MPKQSTPVRVATAVTVQDPADRLHCRKLHQVLQGAADKARLRAGFRGKVLELQLKSHRDGLIRRLFSREEIELERLAVRGALISAAANVTPERLRRLGSPGRRAVRTLRDAGGLDLDRDVKAGQVRSAIALLAGGIRKRTFIDSPVKLRSAWLAQTGANTLASGDGARRVQLHAFCRDSGATHKLAALLARSGDKPVLIIASISIFRAAALSFIMEGMNGGKSGSQALAAQIRKRSESMLLRLFIARWHEAVAAGKNLKTAFPWFDAVNWLVVAMHGDRPTSPGATRSPRSARVVSPSAAPPVPAKTAAPVPEAAAQRLRSRASASTQRAQMHKQPLVFHPPPQPGLPQRGRQGVSLRMLNQLRSPTRLSDTPTAEGTVTPTALRNAVGPGAVITPCPQAADPAPASETRRVARTATLLDVALELLSTQSDARPGGSAGGRLPGSPGMPALPDKGQ